MNLTDYMDFAVFFILLGLFLFIIFSQTLSMLHRVYIFLHLSFMHWALLQFASKATELLHFKFLLVQTSYLVLSSISVIFYMFSIYVINRLSWFKSWSFRLSLIPALALFVIIIFNPNQLFLTAYNGPALEKAIGQGPLFSLLIVVSAYYVINIFALLIKTYSKAKKKTTVRRHISFTLIGLGIIILFAAFDVIYNIVFIDAFDAYFPFLSLGMLISGSFMTFRINRNNVLNIISLAHKDVANTMSVGILIIDRDNYVVEMNKHIYSILKLKVGDILDLNVIRHAFPFNNWKEILRLYDKQKSNRYAVVAYDVLLTKMPERHCHVECHPIIDSADVLIGYMYTIQDVTQMKSLIESTKLHNSLLQQRNGELIRTQEELYEANKKLEKMTITDPLTECYNRRYLIEFLNTELTKNIEKGQSFSIVVIDIDHFKAINDNYGHLAGDEVLKFTANKIKSCIGVSDFISRYGGEEFVVYLKHNDEHEAEQLVERLKQEVQNNEIRLENINETITVTVSLGVVSVDEFESFHGMETNNLQYDIMAIADRALYEAKKLGRNTIVKRDYVSEQKL